MAGKPLARQWWSTSPRAAPSFLTNRGWQSTLLLERQRPDGSSLPSPRFPVAALREEPSCVLTAMMAARHLAALAQSLHRPATLRDRRLYFFQTETWSSFIGTSTAR